MHTLFSMQYGMMEDGFVQCMERVTNCYAKKDLRGFYDLCKELISMATYVGSSRIFFLLKKIVRMVELKLDKDDIWNMYPAMVEYIQEFIQYLGYEC